MKTKWLETIHVQASGGRAGAARERLSTLACQLLESKRPPGLLRAEAYSHFALGGDLVLQLLWETAHMSPAGSDPGLLITQMMNSYGLVDHSVYQVIKGDDHA